MVHYKHYIISFCVLFFVTSGINYAESCKETLFINFISNPTAKADLAQCEGFLRLIKIKEDEAESFFCDDSFTQGDLSKKLKCKRGNVVVFCGKYGIKAIKSFISNPTYRKKDWIIVSLSHMFFEKDYINLESYIDVLILPKHEVKLRKSLKTKFKGKLQTTSGILHNTNIESLKKEFEYFEGTTLFKKLEKVKERLIVFVLGGDAITPDGSTKIFTEMQALIAVKKTIKALPNTHIIIINGPRTGSHMKNGKCQDVDAISINIINWMSEHKPNNFTFVNFNKKESNKYKALLYLIKEKDGALVLPGESVSMMSEAKSVMGISSVYYYKNKAMGENHKSFVSISVGEGWLAQIGSKHKQTRHWTGYVSSKGWIKAIRKKCSKKSI